MPMSSKYARSKKGRHRILRHGEGVLDEAAMLADRFLSVFFYLVLELKGFQYALGPSETQPDLCFLHRVSRELLWPAESLASCRAFANSF